MIRRLDGLAIRKRLGRELWGTPVPFGPDGWRYDSKDGQARVIVTCWDSAGGDFVHASISRAGVLPSYDDLKMLHRAVWADRYAYQLFVPEALHVNIHEFALHLWGRLDGADLLPMFRFDEGTI